jgi:hypothetical protein
MTLLHPLESGLQLGSICMAGISQSIGRIAKRYYTHNINGKKKVTAMSKLLLKIRHKQILLRQLLLLRADGLDKVLHNFLVILLKSAKC